MAYTYSKIASVTVGSGGVSSIDFLAIPQNYTDLVLKLSTRSTGSATNINIAFNGNTSAIYDTRRLYGNGASALSDSFTNQNTGYFGWQTQSTYTANTFSNIELYIPNYTGSTNKTISNDGVSENNATTAQQTMQAIIWRNTSAITSISMSDGGANFAQYSTATLYGIKAEV